MTDQPAHDPAARVASLLRDERDHLAVIVSRLAAARPFGITPKVRSLYCTLCGAIEGAGDEHAEDCPWRMARAAHGRPGGWPPAEDQ